MTTEDFSRFYAEYRAHLIAFRNPQVQAGMEDALQDACVTLLEKPDLLAQFQTEEELFWWLQREMTRTYHETQLYKQYSF